MPKHCFLFSRCTLEVEQLYIATSGEHILEYVQGLPPVAQHEVVNHSLNFVDPTTGVQYLVPGYWPHCPTLWMPGSAICLGSYSTIKWLLTCLNFVGSIMFELISMNGALMREFEFKYPMTRQIPGNYLFCFINGFMVWIHQRTDDNLYHQPWKYIITRLANYLLLQQVITDKVDIRLHVRHTA